MQHNIAASVPFKEHSEDLFQNVAAAKTLHLYLLCKCMCVSAFERLILVQVVCNKKYEYKKTQCVNYTNIKNQ